MEKNNLIFNLKIVFAIVAAFIISSILSPSIFFEKTPKVNYFFLARLKNNFMNKFFAKKLPYKNLLTTPLSAMTPIAQGVYAKEDKDLKTIYVRITKEAKWEEKFIEINGQKILIRYPL